MIRAAGWIFSEERDRAVRLDTLTGQPRAVCHTTEQGVLRLVAVDPAAALVQLGDLGRDLEEAQSLCDRDLEAAGVEVQGSMTYRIAERLVEETTGLDYEAAVAEGYVLTDGSIDTDAIAGGT